MPIRTVMVHYAGGEISRGRAVIAAELARRFGARLIGAAAYPAPISVSGDLVGGEQEHLSGGDFVEADAPAPPDTAPMRAWLGGVADEFRALADDNRTGWRSTIGDPTEFIVAQARVADLIVLGASTAGPDPELMPDAATVLLQSGRPLLVVPLGVQSLNARKIVVGWKETPEARRAVREALPFAHQAERITIVTVDDSGPGSTDPAPLADVAAYLASHNVTAPTEPLVVPMGDSVAGTLVGLAQQRSADLIVVGGYGRGRVAEWVFGGVTRELLTSSPVCCLFSH